MSGTASDFGRYAPAASSWMRPRPDVELAAYGGSPLFKGKRVLDIGTGDGRLALGLARWAREVVGLDPDAAAIKDARANAKRLRARTVSFRIGTAQGLPFASGSFDVVVLSWVL